MLHRPCGSMGLCYMSFNLPFLYYRVYLISLKKNMIKVCLCCIDHVDPWCKEPPRYDDQPLNKCNFFFPFYILCVHVSTRVINTSDSASPPDDEHDTYNDNTTWWPKTHINYLQAKNINHLKKKRKRDWLPAHPTLQWLGPPRHISNAQT